MRLVLCPVVLEVHGCSLHAFGAVEVHGCSLHAFGAVSSTGGARLQSACVWCCVQYWRCTTAVCMRLVLCPVLEVHGCSLHGIWCCVQYRRCTAAVCMRLVLCPVLEVHCCSLYTFGEHCVQYWRCTAAVCMRLVLCPVVLEVHGCSLHAFGAVSSTGGARLQSACVWCCVRYWRCTAVVCIQGCLVLCPVLEVHGCSLHAMVFGVSTESQLVHTEPLAAISDCTLCLHRELTSTYSIPNYYSFCALS